MSEFRIGELANILEGENIIPSVVTGLGVQKKETPETDSHPTEYFPLKDGRFVRVILKDRSLTPQERKLIRSSIDSHVSKLGL